LLTPLKIAFLAYWALVILLYTKERMPNAEWAFQQTRKLNHTGYTVVSQENEVDRKKLLLLIKKIFMLVYKNELI